MVQVRPDTKSSSNAMRCAMAAGVISLTFGLLPVAASAQRPLTLHARTAGELAELCAANPRDPRGAAEVNYCHGFAQGAADVLLGTAGTKKPFCFPSPPPTRTATLTQFVEWVRSAPDHARLPAARGLAQFLGERFPCP